MTSSSNLILQHYIKLTEFLGKALGPDYEVALHDLTRAPKSKTKKLRLPPKK